MESVVSYLLLVLVFLSLYSPALCDGCTPLHTYDFLSPLCTCKYNGQMVTLQYLSEKHPRDFAAKFSIPKEGDASILYQPCMALGDHVATDCKNSAVCEERNGSFPAGSLPPSITGIPASSADGTLKFTYDSQLGSDKKYRRTEVQLVCSNSDPEVIDFQCFEASDGGPGTKSQPIVIKCTFESKYCCLQPLPLPPKKGLSVGSILLILLFVGIILYLIGGILYNKCARGATGFEVIPHYTTWTDFPALVKDGCIFSGQAFCCCKRSETNSYDNI